MKSPPPLKTDINSAFYNILLKVKRKKNNSYKKLAMRINSECFVASHIPRRGIAKKLLFFF